MRKISLNEVFLAVIILAGLVGMMMITRYGIGLSPDSLTYLGAAKNIHNGYGFTIPPNNTPITHFAPLFSFIMGLTGDDPAVSARWFNAFLFALNILLVNTVIRITAISTNTIFTSFANLGAAIVLFSPNTVEIHSMAWTEPLFIALLILALLFAARFLHTKNYANLIASGLIVAAAILTRYAGISVWAAICFGLFMANKRKFTRTMLDIALFSAVSLAPAMLWLFRNYFLSGSAVSRTINVHVIGEDILLNGITSVASWLLIPDFADGVLKLAGVASLGAIIFTGIYAKGLKPIPDQSSGRTSLWSELTKLFVIFSAVYPLFLLFSISFIDANTPLDQRILSPLYISTLILLMISLDGWSKRFNHRITTGIIIGFPILIGLFGFAGKTFAYGKNAYENGIGFHSVYWRNSQILHEIQSEMNHKVIYSNLPEVIIYYTGRNALKIPSEMIKVEQKVNPYYESQISQLKTDVADGAQVILFSIRGSNASVLSPELFAQLNFSVIKEFPEGIVYSR